MKTFSLGDTIEDFLRCLNLLLSPLKDSQKWLMRLSEGTHILNYPWHKSSPQYQHLDTLPGNVLLEFTQTRYLMYL